MARCQVIDCETLGRTPSAIILSASMITFDMDTYRSFEDLIRLGLTVKLDKKAQHQIGRTTDTDVIEWWKEQSKEAQQVLFSHDSDKDVDKFLKLWKMYNEKTGFDPKEGYLYIRGPHFDEPMLAHMIRQHGLDPTEFYNPFKVRDVRTLIDTNMLTDTGYFVSDVPMPGRIAHDGKHDCARDIILMQDSFTIGRGIEIIPK